MHEYAQVYKNYTLTIYPEERLLSNITETIPLKWTQLICYTMKYITQKTVETGLHWGNQLYFGIGYVLYYFRWPYQQSFCDKAIIRKR